MSKHDKDTDEQYISELYSALSDESTPAELDKKILAEAQQAVVNSSETGADEFVVSKKGVGSSLRQWRTPFSLAAVIVLSVTVVVTIEKDRSSELMSPPSKSLPQAEFKDESPSLLRRPAGQENIIQEKRREAKLATPKAKLKMDVARVDEDNNKERRKQLVMSAPSVMVNKISGKQQVEKKAPASMQIASSAPKPARQALSEIEQEVAESPTTAPLASGNVDRFASVSKERSRKEKQVLGMASGAAASVEEELREEDAKATAKKESRSKQALTDVDQSNRAALMRISPAPLADPADARAFVKSEPQNPLQAMCNDLAIYDCLSSRQCTLELDNTRQEYQCRINRNKCEQDFSQAADSEETCNAREGCQYYDADCFCLPGQQCMCDGGTPARCILK